MDQESFCSGFVLGGVLLGGMGYIAQQITLARRRSKMADAKQPIPMQAGKSPRETMRQAQRATLTVIMWTIVLIALVVFAGFVIAQLF